MLEGGPVNEQPFNPPVLVDPSGRPSRLAVDDSCPQCGKGEEARQASGGFGTPWTVCSCGFEWKDRVFTGKDA